MEWQEIVEQWKQDPNYQSYFGEIKPPITEPTKPPETGNMWQDLGAKYEYEKDLADRNQQQAEAALPFGSEYAKIAEFSPKQKRFSIVNRKKASTDSEYLTIQRDDGSMYEVRVSDHPPSLNNPRSDIWFHSSGNIEENLNNIIDKLPSSKQRQEALEAQEMSLQNEQKQIEMNRKNNMEKAMEEIKGHRHLLMSKKDAENMQRQKRNVKILLPSNPIIKMMGLSTNKDTIGLRHVFIPKD